MAKSVYVDDAYSYNGESVKFVIKKNGTIVEKGVAVNYDYPIVFYLNRTAQAYLSTDLDNLETGVHSHPAAAAAFAIENLSGGTIYSQTYVNGAVEQRLSNPVNGHADPRMKILLSTYNSTSTSITI